MARILLGIMELSLRPAVYSSATVEKDIREFFRSERKRLKLNQSAVAEAGGIEQSTISKIERDAPYQPSVVIFLGAIRGLGMMASEFFAKFEQHHLAQRSDRVGPSEKTNVRLITEEAARHNVTPKSPGVTHDAEATALRNPDVAAIERIRFALREAGTLLLDAGLPDAADQPVGKAHARTAASAGARDRSRKTPSGKRSA